MTLVFCLLIFLPKILIGFAIIHGMWKDSDIPAIILKLAIGVPLGLALSTTMFFFTSLAGIRPQIYSQIEFWIVLSLIIFLIARTVSSLKNRHWKSLEYSWQDILGACIVIAGTALSIGAFLFYTNRHLYGFEDAWSIWNLTARFIYRTNSSNVLLDSQFYNRFHPDYPVELSLSVAWGWLVLKSETPRLPIAVALLTTFTPAALVWATLRKWRGTIVAALGALVLLMSTNLPSAVGQYADALLALHMLSAAALFYSYLCTSQRGLLILAGLLAGFSAWVKNEGLLFVCVFSVICLLATWKQVIHWRALRWLVIGITPPLLVVLAYKIIVNGQSDLFSGTISFTTQIFDLSRWQIVGQDFITYIIKYGNWPLSIVAMLLVYAMLMGGTREETQHQIWLFLIFAGQLAGYFGIYLITPHDLQWHIKTSVDRLISHLYPLAIFWIFIALRSPDLSIGHNQSRKPEYPQ
ncbi:MAG: hypothetical protein ABIQ77_01115 [Anaerolineales bacterium]